MATASRKPKGILKKALAAEKQPAVDPRELAIQHAKILQYRKDLEAEILESLILLSEYPVVREAPYNSSNPAPSDVADFKSHIRLFQPSDYDDLIIERNVNGLCGYVLCAKPRRDMGPGGEWKIMSSGEIMRRKDLEQWCSQKCARRALYVKVQLNETAAWERAELPNVDFDLLDEDKPKETEEERVARQLSEMKLEDQRQAARDVAALALERGESGPSSGVKVPIRLKEKDVKTPITEAEASKIYDDDHLVIEGYKTKPETDEDKQT